VRVPKATLINSRNESNQRISRKRTTESAETTRKQHYEFRVPARALKHQPLHGGSSLARKFIIAVSLRLALQSMVKKFRMSGRIRRLDRRWRERPPKEFCMKKRNSVILRIAGGVAGVQHGADGLP
jgi:hypothetical protein